MKDLIKLHFPYPNPNPGQFEAIEQSIQALQDGYEHVIIEAPTGIGKSAISYTIHRVMDEIKRGFVSTVITSTKALQDQYVKEFIVENLTGKANYSCKHKVGPYNSLDCRSQLLNKLCKPEKECSYYRQRKVWTDLAGFRMTNHSFMIEACPMLCMTVDNRSDLIIIDESHEIEQSITEHSQVKLNINSLDSFPDFKIRLTELINMINQNKEKVFTLNNEQLKYASSVFSRCNILIETIDSKIKQSISGLKKFIAVQESMHQLQDYLEILCKPNILWIITDNKNSSFVNLKPIKASDVSHHGLFRKSDQFVHMTSTICGHETYAKSLGIKNYKFIQIDNPIPVKNRKVYYKPVCKVSGDIDYSNLTKGVDMISSMYSQDSGIIHTVSFKLANEIYNRSKHKSRMKVLSDRHEILEHLSTKNGIVLSPSLEKGFDARDDLARFQILAKVPYGYLGDVYIKYNAESNKDWYARNTILRLVQASGRVVRGINDYGDTFILDSNFKRLYDENKHVFPDWYKDSLELK